MYRTNYAAGQSDEFRRGRVAGGGAFGGPKGFFLLFFTSDTTCVTREAEKRREDAKMLGKLFWCLS